MEPKRVIFVSAVSNEFHNAPPGKRHLFKSYREVLEQAFRILAPHYEVIIQEHFAEGFGDLLETLDHEIARSLLVIHLVGDLAGYVPEPAPCRNLRSRHPDLLTSLPELRAAVGDGAGITYTQWELYLAFHYGKRRLIYLAQPDTPRSPMFAPTPADAFSQAAHLRRIEATGAHRGPFQDQGDVTRKAIRSFLHFRVDTTVDPVEPSAEALAAAWAHQEEIVQHLAAAIKKPDPRAVPVTDSANTAAFIAAVRAAAHSWQVNLMTIVDIAARHAEKVRAAAEQRATPETLHDLAFTELAQGDYTAARFWSRRAADLSQKLRLQQPDDEPFHREAAVNALLLLHEAAKAAHDIPAAIAAFEEAGSLVNKETDPLLWAGIHEPLASFLLEQAKLDRAEELINDLVDIREEHQGESHRELGGTLLLWAHLLYFRANYSGIESVASRAERIFAGQNPPDLVGVAAAIGHRALALEKEGRLAEAEPLMRRALAIAETSFGPDHPNVAGALNNLAALLQATNRLAEAEPLIRRALAIDETSFGPDHPNAAIRLNNLAALLQATNRLAEAERLLRRALAIDETSFGSNHPNVTAALSNLAQLLKATNRLAEAEPLMRRVLAIAETSFGPDHPNVTAALINLAQLLQATNRLAEAEPLLRRALAIAETSFGPDHPEVATALNNLAGLLQATNRLAEAEPLMRRALAIAETTFGPNHPNVANILSHLAQLLKATNRLAETEPLMRRVLAIAETSFGPDHPEVATALNNLATLLQASNRLPEAERLLRRALAIFETSFGPEHPNVATALSNLAQLLQATNRLAEAEPLLRRALAIAETSFGPDHPEVANILSYLPQLLKATNRLAEAEPLIRRALAIDETSFGPDHPNAAIRLNNLAALLQATNRLAEAERLLRRALAIDETSFGSNHPNVAAAINNLAALLQDTNRLAEAEPLMRRVVEIFFKFTVSTGHQHPHLQAAVGNYAGLLQQMGRSKAEVLAQLNDIGKAYGIQFGGGG